MHFIKECVIIIKLSVEAVILMIVGVADVEGTPVPIPNTAVKLNSAEDTWVAAPWENRKMPTLKIGYVSYSIFFCVLSILKCISSIQNAQNF